ncbi:DUF6795 domain-containing protein [Limnobacter sp.]|uniref:DUF6795 domain-containing protein n=1 Tax=Limnobacter sp. TaxID=2003368 RepID=UPI003511268C
MFRKIVYCSPIEGVVHWQGKPLANVLVTRQLHSGGFDSGKFTDSTTTSGAGQFKFAVVQERRLFSPDLLSANPRVSQFLIVRHQEFDYLVWSFDKLNFNLGSEAVGGTLKIDCDLSTFEPGSDLRVVRCKNNGVRQYE